MSLINCIKTKQHFIIGLSFAFEQLYNLANITLTQLTKPEFTGQWEEKIKMAIRKQIDRLGKSFLVSWNS
jgi:hypothetical protein